jgi:hypothetical protein
MGDKDGGKFSSTIIIIYICIFCCYCVNILVWGKDAWAVLLEDFIFR